MQTDNSKGKVYLVGAGPGDPELITVKGLRCIEIADVIVYDYLAADELLSHAGEKAERIYVGKKAGQHTLSQEKINELLVEKALKGLTVTRLKGGDPFVFGRGGEEIEVLSAQNIEFEVVPGVTAAVAATAYAGIPLTHRKMTSTVAFVTGHEDPTKEKSLLNYKALAEGIGTLVFFMGVKNLSHITHQLIEGGKTRTTPVSVIRWGTTPRQQVVTGTLENIEEKVLQSKITAPALIVVGDVVNLRPTMKWFENRKLFGKKIIVTRARAQASDLTRKLTDLGAICLESPTIQIFPPDDWSPVDDAIDNIFMYDWIIFTSVNGVSSFFDRLFVKGFDIRSLSHIKTAVIGPATQKKLRSYGLNSDIVPENYLAESVVSAFMKESINGSHILVPRAKDARSVLITELQKMGAIVNEVTVYQTGQVQISRDEILKELRSGGVDMVTFTSSSTVRNFKEFLPPEESDLLLKNVACACIGPITADTAEELGFTAHPVASEYTIDGLVKSILEYFDRH